MRKIVRLLLLVTCMSLLYYYTVFFIYIYLIQHWQFQYNYKYMHYLFLYVNKHVHVPVLFKTVMNCENIFLMKFSVIESHWQLNALCTLKCHFSVHVCLGLWVSPSAKLTNQNVGHLYHHITIANHFSTEKLHSQSQLPAP